MPALQAEIDLLAIGEILVDLISTEPAENLQAALVFRRMQGGSPANLCANLARLGGRSALVAKVGSDAFGKFLAQEMAASGVQPQYIREDANHPTSLVFVARTAGTPDFQPYRGADCQIELGDIPFEVFDRVRMFHATTWPLSRQPSRDSLLNALAQARALGKSVSFDPNYSPKVWPDPAEARRVLAEAYQYVTITKASIDDAVRIFGEGSQPDEYIQRFHALGPKVVVFTLGRQGSMVSEDGRILERLPARQVQVVDATGAGDAFWAGFLTALLDQQPLQRCLRFAREVVEIKLQTLGPLPANMNLAEIYSRLD
jgi:fructokinase